MSKKLNIYLMGTGIEKTKINSGFLRIIDEAFGIGKRIEVFLLNNYGGCIYLNLMKLADQFPAEYIVPDNADGLYISGF